MNIIKKYISIAILSSFLSACTSTSAVITEYDGNGNLVKQTTTQASLVKEVIESTQHKTIVRYDNSWLGYISISMATPENPTPHFRAGIGKNDEGFISWHKEHDITKMPDVIKASREQYIDLSATGISTTSGTKIFNNTDTSILK